ncbi:transposase [Nocardia brasiliensis]|uniref:IS110 family transposase n=1 Tax=Nocardia brasiliensis TaxID=37326 RepID=UPI003670B19A
MTEPAPAPGNGRKTDAVDAHSVALAALHAPRLRRVTADPELVALGLLADRRDGLGRARTEILNRIHRLLLELIPGGAKKFLSATQARDLIAELRARDPVGRVRLRLVIEMIEELETIDRKTKAADKELRQLITDHGSTLMELHGIGPSSAARLLADTADIHRFASRDRFASWNSHCTVGCFLRQIGNAIDSPAPGTAKSTECSTSWPSFNYANQHRRPRLLRRPQSGRENLDGSHARTRTPTLQRRRRPECSTARSSSVRPVERLSTAISRDPHVRSPFLLRWSVTDRHLAQAW